MKIQKQREIVVEFERVEIVRKRTRTTMVFCRECSQETDFLAVSEAAILFSVNADALLAFVQREKCHFETTDEGAVVVCLSSLLSRMKTLVNGVASLRP